MCGKMAEELLSLKWNNHQAHFVDILTFLREQEIFVDATLACGGKLYAAHKFVLSTCSDYFKQMFTKNPSKHPIVFMKDVTSRDLEALLDFMYNGEVNVPQSSLGSLIKTAEGLQIKGLAVPDDPPVSKRERERDREKKDSKTQHEHHSPPAKRARPRERSPPHSTPSQPPASLPQSSYTSTTPTVPRSRSPQPPAPSAGASQIGIPPVEATLDEDSRTSVQSGVSGLSEQNSSTTPSLSSKQGSSQPVGNTGDNASQLDQLPPSHSGEEPSPGPSGIHKPQQSKEEPEMEIKQEDVVDLGEEDEGDWGVEGDGGGGDSSVGSENHPNFPEVMLPHTDGSMPPSGDPAMSGGDSLLGTRRDLKRDPDLAPATILGLDSHLTSNFLRVDAAAAAAGGMYHALVDAATGSRTDIIKSQLSLNPMRATVRSDFKASLNPTTASVTGLDDTVERPYPCQFCDARFKKKQHLQNHERIHTGEKYVCTLCGQAFSRMHILKHHLEKKHADPPNPVYHLDQ
ncbi:broad-complex core protein isoforms 1/2/3/4/5 isoform X8 [Penaeus vannamei]|uniref:broad-complex core protein isoforms 1/2/3/4/5-like isoform X3 n=1 Tax=Penaeus chinensis TaxID=139456 RepID=UPI001FB58BEF|nr:broad-complex core protein isoforms 1/2/3/4/5-like isoform X3 [Penaeus chinensis]